MAYLNSVKMLSTFNSTQLYDSGARAFWSVAGSDGTVSVLADGLGYVMQQNQYLQMPVVNADVSQALSIGFWLYSVHPGVVVENGQAKPLFMPLLHFASDEVPDEYGGAELLRIYETVQVDGRNALNVTITDSDGSLCASVFPSYITGRWHHFFFVFDGTSRALTLIMDGKRVTATSTSGIFPDRIDGSVLSAYINRQTVLGHSNWTNNYGYIDDVLLLNEAKDDEGYVAKIIDHGINYAVDQENEHVEEATLTVFADDPSVVKTTSALRDGGHVFASRSDGRVLCGSPLLWTTRRNFSEQSEAEAIEDNESAIFSSAADKSTAYSVGNGYLQITNCIIRF